MKEGYFTKENFSDKALELFIQVQKYRKRHPFTFEVDHAALLIIDMQSYFLKEVSHAFVPSAPMIIPGILRLAAAFINKNQPIYLTQHVNTSKNAFLMKTWWNDIIREDNPLSAIIPELRSLPASIIKKQQYDAFFHTDLEQQLKDKNIDQLVVTGIVTHLCVETTIRSAFMRGFFVVLPVDATASYSESFHQASLMNMCHGCAYPVLSEEIIKKCQG